MNDAINFHNSALIIDPNYKTSLYNLGNIMQGLGQLGQAVSFYKSALKIDSNICKNTLVI